MTLRARSATERWAWGAAYAVVGLLAIGCASSGGAHARASCGLRSRDSTYLTGGAVYRDCAVDRKAKLVSSATRPDFRPTTPRTTCYSADLEFVVDTLGVPEIKTASVVRTNEPAYGDAVLAGLPSWRYDPAIIDGRPVRQIVNEHQALSAIVSIVVAGSPPPRPLPRPPSC